MSNEYQQYVSTLEKALERVYGVAERAREKGLLFMVDFHKRPDQYHQGLHAKLREGKFGRIMSGQVKMHDRREVSTEWFTSWSLQPGNCFSFLSG